MGRFWSVHNAYTDAVGFLLLAFLKSFHPSSILTQRYNLNQPISVIYALYNIKKWRKIETPISPNPKKIRIEVEFLSLVGVNLLDLGLGLKESYWGLGVWWRGSEKGMNIMKKWSVVCWSLRAEFLKEWGGILMVLVEQEWKMIGGWVCSDGSTKSL